MNNLAIAVMDSGAAVPDASSSGEEVPANSFTHQDEADLRAYYAIDPPPPPGTTSVFGAMCERVSNATNPKSDQRPTPHVVNRHGEASGAAWTEILDCHESAEGGVNSTEDAMIAHIDACRMLAEVGAVLSCLTCEERRVLKACFGVDASASSRRLGGGAALTAAAARAREERMSDHRYESVEETIQHLLDRAKDRNHPEEARERARKTLGAIRREAAELLHGACASYARARDGVSS